MPSTISISGKDYILSHPKNDSEFEAIVSLNKAVHGEVIEALCHTLDRHFPGMQRDLWYAVSAPDSPLVLSTLCLIPSHWTMNFGQTQVRIPVAEMGIVATAEQARGLGLSSFLIGQFLHDAKRSGYQLASIEGIPYFYHRFGFEYAVPLMVKQQLPLEFCQQLLAESQPPAFSLRPWQAADRPAIENDFRQASTEQQLKLERSPEHWTYLLGPSAGSPETFVERHVLLDGKGKYAGYIGIQKDCFGPTLALAEASLPQTEAGLPPECFLQAAELLRRRYELPHISLLLPESHPLSRYTAQRSGLEPSSYGWQMQVLEPLGWLRSLRPLLQARLTASAYAGTPRRLILDLYKCRVLFDWSGTILTVKEADSDERGPSLPPELLAPLSLGFRNCAELALCRLDASIGQDDRHFLDTMFPKLDAFIYPYF